MFTVQYINEEGNLTRDICDWSVKQYASDKAKQLKTIFKGVKVVPVSKAPKFLPIVKG